MCSLSVSACVMTGITDSFTIFADTMKSLRMNKGNSNNNGHLHDLRFFFVKNWIYFSEKDKL